MMVMMMVMVVIVMVMIIIDDGDGNDGDNGYDSDDGDGSDGDGDDGDGQDECWVGMNDPILMTAHGHQELLKPYTSTNTHSPRLQLFHPHYAVLNVLLFKVKQGKHIFISFLKSSVHYSCLL